MWIFMSDYLSRCTLQSAFHHLKCDYMVRWDLHIVTLKCETFCAAELSSVHTVTGPHCIIQIAYKLSRLALVENWPFDNMFTICSFKMNQVHILFFPIIPFSSSLHKSEVDYNITVNSIFALNNINLFKTFFPLLAYVSDFTALYFILYTPQISSKKLTRYWSSAVLEGENSFCSSTFFTAFVWMWAAICFFLKPN